MTAQIIQQRLQQVGVDVRIRVVEWAAFLKEFIDKGNFEVVLLAWMTSQDPDMYDIWHSSKTKPGELNFIGYNNPEVDRLLEEGRSTFAVDKRKKPTFGYRRFWRRNNPTPSCMSPTPCRWFLRGCEGLNRPRPASVTTLSMVCSQTGTALLGEVAMLPVSDIHSVAHAIQLAVAPVFLLTGIGAMLSVMTNRLAG